ncbi:glycosyltransferase family 2 protein [Stenotrophomonas tumulicola]|nr:glycosyltransferase family 2 protein [Stenotrophomonas tumulicola]
MIELQLQPIRGVTLGAIDSNGMVELSAFGDDPQCRLVPAKGGQVEGGWYELSFVLEETGTRMVDPVLYANCGAGMTEKERVPLHVTPHTDGISRTLVPLSGRIVELRFDPSIGPCEIRIGRFAMRRVGQAYVALSMFREVLYDLRGRRAKLRFTLDSLRSLLTDGRSGLGGFLRARYSAMALHNAFDYDAWVALYGALSAPERGEVEAWDKLPTFSIVVPTYNTPEKWLRRCVQTVTNQSYPHWELCVADDASPKPHVVAVLKELAAADPRIKFVVREQNGHISASSNDALKLATGDFIVLLDHDDELHPHALYEMAKAFRANPSWQMAFSDEDKIDEKGRRFDPYFKADWNYDLFLSHNCISHLGVYARGLVDKVGGFRLGYEGSQDWDLALRCIETLDDSQIGHVPHVLYHWRAIPGSTALGPGEKSYAHYAAMKSIQSHLDRIGRDAEVLDIPNFSGNYRVRNRLPVPAPRVSLIIPTRDRADLLRMAVTSILEKTDYPDYEIIIVNNQSVEPDALELLQALQQDSRVSVIDYDAPFNYSAINNLGVSKATGSIVGLLNNDIEVISSDWLTEMASQAVRPEVGAVGAMLYFPNDSIQHAGVILGFNGVGVHAYADRPRGWVGMMLRARLLQNFSAVTAACLLVRKSVYEQVDGLDTALQVAYNDMDFCLRVREAGYRNLWTPYAELYHHESASRGSDMEGAKRERFDREVALVMSRWSSVIAADPAYNPNLAATGNTFDLAFPPRHRHISAG